GRGREGDGCMNEPHDETTIRKTLVVDAPAERAFRVFSQSMGSWWPKEHHIGKSPLKECVIEPRVGGRWYEVGEDGSQCEWGKVPGGGPAPPARARLAARRELHLRRLPDHRSGGVVHRARAEADARRLRASQPRPVRRRRRAPADGHGRGLGWHPRRLRTRGP